MSVGDFDRAWAAELDRMELDVELAERIVNAHHLPSVDDIARWRAWVPPSALGPLPVALHERAQALLDRHRRVADELTRAMTVNRRQLAALDQARRRSDRAPVYCDLTA